MITVYLYNRLYNLVELTEGASILIQEEPIELPCIPRVGEFLEIDSLDLEPLEIIKVVYRVQDGILRWVDLVLDTDHQSS